MAERISFHLDENADPDIAKGLRRYGIDATTSQEAGLLGTEDSTQLQFAVAHGRVIVTHDQDLLALSASQPHCGIAYCDMNTRSTGQIINSLILIYEVLTPEEMKGRIEYL